ncbi:MAG: hypothetical protein HRT88_00190 [Lentisphaeraceae bacterium]|nr:hypothetical protein [Lentisphaeraceae bacterium]
MKDSADGKSEKKRVEGHPKNEKKRFEEQEKRFYGLLGKLNEAINKK